MGGLFSSLFAKPGYNIKIRGGDILYGRKQFKIRSDGQDPTFLRIKLISDIRSHLGFPSISTSFIQLYINDEFMGFYIIMLIKNHGLNMYMVKKIPLLYINVII